MLTFLSRYSYFTFLTECKNPKACTILLRGPSKDILHEIDRNLADAMAVARNVVFDPRLAPGGGATEMAISVGLNKKARSIEGVEGWPFRAVAEAMEVIPRTLVQNCGGNAIRVLTELRVRWILSIYMTAMLTVNHVYRPSTQAASTPLESTARQARSSTCEIMASTNRQLSRYRRSRPRSRFVPPFHTTLCVIRLRTQC